MTVGGAMHSAVMPERPQLPASRDDDTAAWYENESLRFKVSPPKRLGDCVLGSNTDIVDVHHQLVEDSRWLDFGLGRRRTASRLLHIAAYSSPAYRVVKRRLSCCHRSSPRRRETW